MYCPALLFKGPQPKELVDLDRLLLFEYLSSSSQVPTQILKAAV